jgi:GT2 family glycosyltransferase
MDERPAGSGYDLTVVVCTRNRAHTLARTLDALEAQSERNFAVIVVDQSASPDVELARRAAREPGWSLVRDREPGVARARNIGWRAADSEWIVYLDDDVVPATAWARGLRDAITRYPAASIVMGHTPAGGDEDDDYLTVSAFPVEAERVITGCRWVRPWLIGFTLNQAFRRSTLARLGGFDERLGAGAPVFPSSADMDINFRFLREGGVAVLAPAAAATHEQWRTPAELGPQYERYMRGWTGFALKHVRQGDVLNGLWLWQLGLRDVARMAASALRRRSWLRLRVASHKVRGLAVGTWRGLTYPW